MYLMLTKLVSSNKPDVFPAFCRVLKDTGNDVIAESLVFDKDRIKWSKLYFLFYFGFQRETIWHIMADYVAFKPYSTLL